MEKNERELIKRVSDASFPDNDFDNVYNIDFKALDSIDRKDLIEELLRYRAILEENQIAFDMESE